MKIAKYVHTIYLPTVIPLLLSSGNRLCIASSCHDFLYLGNATLVGENTFS